MFQTGEIIMIKKMMKVTTGTMAGLLVASGSYASEPILLTEAQMDLVTAAGFVCPVFNPDSAVGAHNPNAHLIGGGDYTILGPEVSVPTHATNGDGAGSPPGPHSSPGDTDYTAIWVQDPP
jgi:hypothetical protein